MKLKLLTSIGALALGVYALPIVSVGPFAGEYSEGFEAFPNYNQGPTHQPSVFVLGGIGIAESIHAVIYEPGLLDPDDAEFGLGVKGAATAFDAKGYGANGQSAVVTIDFASDVARFGGYWNVAYHASVAPLNTLTLRAYDRSNNFLGTITETMPMDNSLMWVGVGSSTGIARVTLSGQWIVGDNWQADLHRAAAIPGPAAAMMFGVALLARRRR
jgi:hypothetical protein